MSLSAFGDGVSLLNETSNWTFKPASGEAIFINQDNNSIALNIDSEATTSDVINAEGNTLTTGNGIHVFSSAANTSARSIARFEQTGAAAVNATTLLLRNDGEGDADAGVLINFNNAAEADTDGAVTSLTTGGTEQGSFKIAIAGVTRFVKFTDAPT